MLHFTTSSKQTRQGQILPSTFGISVQTFWLRQCPRMFVPSPLGLLLTKAITSRLVRSPCNVYITPRACVRAHLFLMIKSEEQEGVMDKRSGRRTSTAST